MADGAGRGGLINVRSRTNERPQKQQSTRHRTSTELTEGNNTTQLTMRTCGRRLDGQRFSSCVRGATLHERASFSPPTWLRTRPRRLATRTPTGRSWKARTRRPRKGGRRSRAARESDIPHRRRSGARRSRRRPQTPRPRRDRLLRRQGPGAARHRRVPAAWKHAMNVG